MQQLDTESAFTLFGAIIWQAVRDAMGKDRAPGGERREAARFLDDVYPSWRYEQHLVRRNRVYGRGRMAKRRQS